MMSRLLVAWKAFWSILRSPERAAAWEQACRLPATAGSGAVAAPSAPLAVSPPAAAGILADAVFTLVLLQREGRLVDFLQEPLEGFSDAQVGAAARQVHDDCRRVLQQVFGMEPLRSEPEGSQLSLPAGFDPRHVRLTGSSAAAPPYSGTLRHRGWRVTRVAFPQRHGSLDPAVVCPAEVEVGS
jgi:hypothetical protein